MTLNEARRARDAYMAAKAGDLPTQIAVIQALFVLVEELAARLEALEADRSEIDHLQHDCKEWL